MQYRTKGKSGRNLLVLILGRAILNLFSFNVPAWLSTGNVSQIQWNASRQIRACWKWNARLSFFLSFCLMNIVTIHHYIAYTFFFPAILVFLTAMECRWKLFVCCLVYRVLPWFVVASSSLALPLHTTRRLLPARARPFGNTQVDRCYTSFSR